MNRTVVLTLGVLLLAVFFVGIRIKSVKKVLLISPAVSITPTPEPTPTASESAVLAMTMTATPSATPTRQRTPTPTKAVPTPTPASSQEINGFIDRFAGQYGVDPNVIRYMALCESGFNSSATQGKYIGLFQFDATSWKNIRKQMGEPTDPYLRYSAEESVQTACYAISKGKGRMWPNCMP